MNNREKNVESYLKLPYARLLTPDLESGTYTAEIQDLPGCIAQGDTPQQALENLENAAASWIQVALEQGQAIPEPFSMHPVPSGRIALRLPKTLHRQAAQMAEREGASLNQFLVAAIAEKVGATKERDRLFDQFLEAIKFTSANAPRSIQRDAFLRHTNSTTVRCFIPLTWSRAEAATTSKITDSIFSTILEDSRMNFREDQ